MIFQTGISASLSQCPPRRALGPRLGAYPSSSPPTAASPVFEGGRQHPGFALGVNEWEVIRDVLEETDLDCRMLATGERRLYANIILKKGVLRA